MPPKLVRPAPPYQQIADRNSQPDLQWRTAGWRSVPSVRSLMRDFGVAIATAQRALSSLRAEGYIRPERGVGSIVTTEEERGRAANDRVDKSRRTGKSIPTGNTPRSPSGPERGHRASRRRAGAQARQRSIRRVRDDLQADDKPVSASTSYFRGDLAELAPLLLSTERIREGTFAYIANALKRAVDAWQDQFEPTAATAEQAANSASTRATSSFSVVTGSTTTPATCWSTAKASPSAESHTAAASATEVPINRVRGDRLAFHRLPV